MFSLEVSTECFSFILIIEFQPLFLSKVLFFKNVALKKALIFHKILLESLWLEHDMNTNSCSWTWLILPDWSIAWIQLPVHELGSSCLTGALHEYNYMFNNLIHPARLEHDMNTTFCLWTWIILPDWSMT
jgi:hypothetical protein